MGLNQSYNRVAVETCGITGTWDSQDGCGKNVDMVE